MLVPAEEGLELEEGGGREGGGEEEGEEGLVLFPTLVVLLSHKSCLKKLANKGLMKSPCSTTAATVKAIAILFMDSWPVFNSLSCVSIFSWRATIFPSILSSIFSNRLTTSPIWVVV